LSISIKGTKSELCHRTGAPVKLLFRDLRLGRSSPGAERGIRPDRRRRKSAAGGGPGFPH
jgi:hypothetical protein